MSTQATKALREAIKDIRIAMLTTFDREGHLHSRPMATIDIQFDGDLWFFTCAHSPKVGELGSDSRAERELRRHRARPLHLGLGQGGARARPGDAQEVLAAGLPRVVSPGT